MPFKDSTKWRKFTWSSKASQDGRTLEKGSKTAEFVHEGLPEAPLRMRQLWLLPKSSLRTGPCASRMDTTSNCCLIVFQAVFGGKPLFSLY